MIEISVNLIPYGDRTNEVSIGKITVINDGTGTSAIGNYKVIVEDCRGKVSKFKIDDFERNKGAFNLMELILKKYNKKPSRKNNVKVK